MLVSSNLSSYLFCTGGHQASSPHYFFLPQKKSVSSLVLRKKNMFGYGRIARTLMAVANSPPNSPKNGYLFSLFFPFLVLIFATYKQPLCSLPHTLRTRHQWRRGHLEKWQKMYARVHQPVLMSLFCDRRHSFLLRIRNRHHSPHTNAAIIHTGYFHLRNAARTQSTGCYAKCRV